MVIPIDPPEVDYGSKYDKRTRKEKMMPTYPEGHTPTPWRANGSLVYHRERKPLAVMNTDYLSDCSQDPARSMDSEISEKEAIANAAFIIHACNSHDELVKIARKYKASLEYGNIDEIEEVEKIISRAEGYK